MRPLAFVVPGALSTLTGGYRYDDRMINALPLLGWQTQVHELPGNYPHPCDDALQAAAEVLQALPDGKLVVIDGLALGALPQLANTHRDRLSIIALVHHPLALETGLTSTVASQLEASERTALQAVRGVIVTSQATAHLLAPYNIQPAQIQVVEPGTDKPGYGYPEKTDTHSGAGQFCAANPGLNLLCVASLTARKGHEVLIEALAPWRHSAWTLTCIGNQTREPSVMSRITRQLRANGLEAQVMLPGELDDHELRRHYRQADAFVLASHFEGYGMVFDEAIANGLPVISTRVGAVETAVPAAARLLAPPGDTQALAQALGQFIQDTHCRDAMRQAARAAASQRRSWDEAGADFDRALRAFTV